MLVQGVKKHSVWVVFLGQRSVSKVFSLCYYYFPVVCYGNFILILLILNLLVFTIPILQIEFYISFVCCGKWEVLLHDIYAVYLSVNNAFCQWALLLIQIHELNGRESFRIGWLVAKRNIMHFFIPLCRPIPRYTFISCQAIYY